MNEEKKLEYGWQGSGVSSGPDFGDDRMVILERVGSRYLIACQCGNYLLSGEAVLICDNCGTEVALGDLDRKDRGGDK